MNRRAIGAIVYKDLKIVAQNKNLMLSLLIVPFVMLVIFPALAVLFPTAAKVVVPPLAGLNGLPQHLPANLHGELAGLNAKQRWDVLVLVYFLAPVYLVIPLTNASVIAGYSFAGEKERKTLEALLYTPTTDGELFLAKLLSPWLVGMGLAIVGFVIYAVVANVGPGRIWVEYFFPTRCGLCWCYGSRQQLPDWDLVRWCSPRCVHRVSRRPISWEVPSLCHLCC